MHSRQRVCRWLYLLTTIASMSLLDDLNPGQREAATADGCVAVVAGAGTGKTRVITYRVAWLISQGVAPAAILAVTFTNKAAGEMRDRIRALVPEAGAAPWVGTFHSFCARLLRRDGPLIGIPREFVIYDEDDQLSVIRQALALLGHDERRFPPRTFREPIGYAKNHGWDAERIQREVPGERGRVAASVFDFYNAALRKASALDFDDLLLEAVRLLRESEEARRRRRGQFAHIVVDEFQDVNEQQYELVRLQAGEATRVCVVGDEDQSIYSWRGADPRILRRFLDDFPGARLLRVERNYRSTQTILDAAAGVVSNNSRRLGKTLEATREGDALVRLHEAPSAPAEAAFVTAEILRLLRANPEAHFAVLYRANFQSRPFEEACRRAGLAFRVVGGFSFYQRAEVKNLLAYARLVVNPEDDAALRRVINVPPRGIGKTTLDAVEAEASRAGVSLWAALGPVAARGSGRSALALGDFHSLIEDLRAGAEGLRMADLLRKIAERTGYLDWLEKQDKAEFTDRAGNVKELVAAAKEGQEQGETLAGFLDRAALASDTDNFDERAPVTLITLHSAKGLEFDHVFLVGMEEGLLPHSRSLPDPAAVEEERRLCYVGMTRARLTLTLSRAQQRLSFDRDSVRRAAAPTRPSRFLAEIPPELVERVAGNYGAGTSRLPFAAERGPEDTQVFDERPEAPAGLGGNAKSLLGQKVRHPTFGVGTVLEIVDDGEDRRFLVSFPGVGTRKLIERYAKLRRV